jgi:hypothetical protein
VHWLAQVVEHLGSTLGIEKGKMGKELGVIQIPQAAAGVGHGIGFPSNVIRQRYVAVMEFLECLETKKTSRWTAGGGGPFLLPLDCSDVVRGVMDGCFSNIKGLHQYAMLGDVSSQLKFTVVDVTFRFVKYNKPLLDGIRIQELPYHGFYRTIQLRHKVNPIHAHGGSVLGAQIIRFVFGYDLSNAFGSVSQVLSKPSKVC